MISFAYSPNLGVFVSQLNQVTIQIRNLDGSSQDSLSIMAS